MLLEEQAHNLASNQTTTTAMQSIDEVPVIQTVSCCLASHEQCSGLYSDQHGTIFVKCACPCHEIGGQKIQ